LKSDSLLSKIKFNVFLSIPINFLIFLLTADLPRKVTELEIEKAELLNQLNLLIAKQQQQQQSQETNTSRLLLLKRIADLESELTTTRETLISVTNDLKHCRQQTPILQQEYTALCTRYQQLEINNQNLRIELNKLQEQIKQQQNEEEIEVLRQQLKSSSELIEQLLTEQVKTEQRLREAEQRMKQLQQELDTIRQQKKK
jgi:chromosome segregation ATPase